MNYIGMDTHISTLDFAVVNEAGRLTKAKSIATSVKGFMEFVKQVPAPRTIYMEEGTLAAWALETCVQRDSPSGGPTAAVQRTDGSLS